MPEKKEEKITCEKAQGFAILLFSGLGKSVVGPPYFAHLKECKNCRKDFDKRVKYFDDYGRMMVDAF